MTDLQKLRFHAANELAGALRRAADPNRINTTIDALHFVVDAIALYTIAVANLQLPDPTPDLLLERLENPLPPTPIPEDPKPCPTSTNNAPSSPANSPA